MHCVLLSLCDHWDTYGEMYNTYFFYLSLFSSPFFSLFLSLSISLSSSLHLSIFSSLPLFPTPYPSPTLSLSLFSISVTLSISPFSPFLSPLSLSSFSLLFLSPLSLSSFSLLFLSQFEEVVQSKSLEKLLYNFTTFRRTTIIHHVEHCTDSHIRMNKQ